MANPRISLPPINAKDTHDPAVSSVKAAQSREWSYERDEAIAVMVEGGLSYPKIAEALSIPLHSISSVVSRLRLRRRLPKRRVSRRKQWVA